MLFPISDDDRHLLRPAYVTITLVVANVLVFFYQLGHPDFIYAASVIPLEIVKGVDLVDPALVRAGGQLVEVPQAPGPSPIHLTLLSAMFMHGGWAHLGGNLLYLWIFGDNVEHRFGHLRFLVFYLASGLAASFAQIAMDPHSIIPNLGASGAISGVLGAYLVLFPHHRHPRGLRVRALGRDAVFRRHGIARQYGCHGRRGLRGPRRWIRGGPHRRLVRSIPLKSGARDSIPPDLRAEVPQVGCSGFTRSLSFQPLRC
jgi:membrane associated rhomboid family serine protease